MVNERKGASLCSRDYENSPGRAQWSSAPGLPNRTSLYTPSCQSSTRRPAKTDIVDPVVPITPTPED
jgi:hypothetical protein